MVPHTHLREQVRDFPIEPITLDVEMHEPGILAVQFEYFDERRDAALIAELPRLTEAESSELFPGVIAHVAVSFKPPIEHVVVKDHQDAILRFANIELVAVGAEFEARAKGFQRVLVRVFRRTAVADDVGALAALGDSLVPHLGLLRRFWWD